MIQYDGQHSIDFFGDLDDRGTLNAKNTWRDWHIVPTSKPYVPVGEPQFNLVQIPGSNRILDLTDYLIGKPVYGVRSGEWEFIVDLDYWKSSSFAYSYFMANIHGAKFYCELQDEPGVVYLGRFAIGDYQSSSSYPILKISYKISPTFKVASGINNNGTTNYTDETIPVADNIEIDSEWVDSEIYDL